MTVQLTVLKEEQASETRVAASPETVKKLKAMGVSVTVEAGAGAKSGFDDNDFKQAGAAVTKAIAASLKKADVVVSVRAPSPAKIKSLKQPKTITSYHSTRHTLAARVLVEEHRVLYERARRLMTSPKLKSFKLVGEPAARQQARLIQRSSYQHFWWTRHHRLQPDAEEKRRARHH